MYQYGAGTNVGNVRDNNADSLVCDEEQGLWIVTDGMGGPGFGEVASAITNYTVTRLIHEGHGVNKAIEIAHRNIREYAETDGSGTNMGTTIVLLLSQGSLYNVFWVGDSRAYLLDESGMRQITVDHSLAQTLLDQGELTREEAESDPRKNAATLALGVRELETVRADSISERWQPGQKILLCSDGLTDCVSDTDIETIMRSSQQDQQIVDNLIEAALAGGGKDNITVIVVPAPESVETSGSDTPYPAGKETDREPWSLQLSLELPEPAPVQLEPEPSPEPVDTTNSDEQNSSTSGWVSIGGALAASLFLFMLVMSMDADRQPSALAEKFVGEDLRPVTPIVRNLPDMELEDHAPVLQVGLFRSLDGAESKQGELAELGLSPDIVKRVSGGGILYAVVISPHDETDHRQTLATLQANNLSYFHARRHGT